MALLTAEDVLNKAFSKTKYREGFDQDEVDDFLDEVANAISALTAERDELQTRLTQYQAGGVPVAAATAPAAVAERPAGMSSGSADLLAAATDPNPPSATTMLSMAQKLHDDYVQAGEAERDRIIDEGKSKAESIVEQAETDARVRMQSLDSERADLERRIDDLRRFERDYRGHLRNYLENLLGDLEHNSARGGVSAPGVEASGVDATGVGTSGVGASSTTPEPPLFGGTFAAEQPAAPQEPLAVPEVDQSAQPWPSFDAPAAPEPFAPAAEPMLLAPSAEPMLLAPSAEPMLLAPSAEPEVRAQGFHVSESAPAPSFGEELPPFPGTPQLASPFSSPFKDANPFAPSLAPTEAQAPAEEMPAPPNPAQANPEEEAPRWNF
jgi:DivIVA domain-containing protein